MKYNHNNFKWYYYAPVIVGVAVFFLVLSEKFIKPETENKITVLAAAGLTNAITEIAHEYENASSKQIVLNFNSSSRLAKQIEAGTEADVFISANRQWMDYVSERSLVEPESRIDIATTSLVLIAPKGTGEDVTFDADFVENYAGFMAIGDYSNVPVGIYTAQSLKKLDLWEPLVDNFVLAAKVSDVVKYVETGECDLGICYAASALASDKITILSTFEADTHDPIEFLSAKCIGASSGADDFLSYLASDTSMKIFAANGFTTSDQLLSIKVKHPVITSAEISAVLLSIKVAFVCVVLVIVPGILIGWVLARKNFYGKDIFEAFVNLPLVIPPVVTGYLALLLLGKNGMLGKYLYDTFGFTVAFTWKAAVISSAIMGMPLLIRSVKTAMTMTDIRLEKAALTLGSSPWRVFFTVTLPLALPGILSGVMLAFARSLGEFGATATFAGNIPGKTQTLSLAIHNLTQTPGGDSAALRLTAISILISVAALIGSEIIVRRSSLKGVATNA